MVTGIGKIGVVVHPTEQKEHHLQHQTEQGDDANPVENLQFEVKSLPPKFHLTRILSHLTSDWQDELRNICEADYSIRDGRGFLNKPPWGNSLASPCWLCLVPCSLNTSEAITWVRRVNDRWIVREGLRQSASAYLDHLASIDPARLLESCRRSKALTQSYGSDEDPKPWFYASLFSLATPAEAARFLKEHDFTRAVITGLSFPVRKQASLNNTSESTASKIHRIREVIKGLDKDEPRHGAPKS